MPEKKEGPGAPAHRQNPRRTVNRIGIGLPTLPGFRLVTQAGKENYSYES